MTISSKELRKKLVAAVCAAYPVEDAYVRPPKADGFSLVIIAKQLLEVAMKPDAALWLARVITVIRLLEAWIDRFCEEDPIKAAKAVETLHQIADLKRSERNEVVH